MPAIYNTFEKGKEIHLLDIYMNLPTKSMTQYPLTEGDPTKLKRKIHDQTRHPSMKCEDLVQ